MRKLTIILALFLLTSSGGGHSISVEKETSIDALNKSLDRLKNEVYNNNTSSNDSIVMRGIQADK